MSSKEKEVKRFDFDGDKMTTPEFIRTVIDTMFKADTDSVETRVLFRDDEGNEGTVVLNMVITGIEEGNTVEKS